MGQGNHSTADQCDENNECEKKFHRCARKLMRNAPARQSAPRLKIKPPSYKARRVLRRLNMLAWIAIPMKLRTTTTTAAPRSAMLM